MLVQNKGNYSYTANGLTLIPGVNDVDAKAFDGFLKHPLMKKLDEQGEFVYEKEDKKPSAKEIIALIDDTFDVAVLEQMKADEDRKTVLEAIEKRIEELKGE